MGTHDVWTLPIVKVESELALAARPNPRGSAEATTSTLQLGPAGAPTVGPLLAARLLVSPQSKGSPHGFRDQTTKAARSPGRLGEVKVDSRRSEGLFRRRGGGREAKASL